MDEKENTGSATGGESRAEFERDRFGTAGPLHAASGAKEGASEEHRLLSSGDCSCGWTAGALLSHEAFTAWWELHRGTAENPAPDPPAIRYVLPPINLEPRTAENQVPDPPAADRSVSVQAVVEIWEEFIIRISSMVRTDCQLGAGEALRKFEFALNQLPAAPAGPAAQASIGFGEGKKIYDQGWNDGLEYFRKTAELVLSARSR
jgi:hypothetical protein